MSLKSRLSDFFFKGTTHKPNNNAKNSFCVSAKSSLGCGSSTGLSQCLLCRLCTDVVGCKNCDACIKCQDCSNCKNCLGCKNSFDLNHCGGCTDCAYLDNCLFCTGLFGERNSVLRYHVFNQPVSEEEYKKLLAEAVRENLI